MTKPLLLVIDDEPDMAELIGDVGSSMGFDTAVTTTVSEFQKTYLKEQPDVIVLDIVMPDMDGIELLQWIGKKGSDASIIIISGYSDYIKMTKLIGKNQGCHIEGSLTKPFSLNDLGQLLQKIFI